MTHAMVTAPSGIGYPVWRVGSGPPLLLLHGFTGSHETWQHVRDCLADSHLVATLDLPGHGDAAISGGQSLTFAAVIDDLAWIIDSLLGGHAHLLGYSMGGRLALALAVAYPGRVQSLILESASAGIADEKERRERQLADERLAERMLEDGLDTFVAQWERLPMWESQQALSADTRERQRQIRLSHGPAGLAANLLATGTGVQPSYWEQLGDLKTPTLLIAGELDGKFVQVAARMHEAMPKSCLEIVSNAGHAVHLEQPARYVQAVSQFLDQREERTSQSQRSDRD